MKITSVSGKQIEADLIAVREHTLDEIKEIDSKLHDALKQFFKDRCYRALVQADDKKKNIWVSESEFKRLKTIIAEENRNALRKYFEQRARMIDSSDERTFRKGLSHDWRW